MDHRQEGPSSPYIVTYLGFDDTSLMELDIQNIIVIPYGKNLSDNQNHIGHVHVKSEACIVHKSDRVMSPQRYVIPVNSL